MNHTAQAYEAKKIELIRQRWWRLKSKIKSALHGVFWKVLWLTRLARPYSKTMCRLRLYRKFPDGRCMWCGNIHKGPKPE